MARNFLPPSMEHRDEEDYINIEVSSCSYFSDPKFKVSSPQNREFEFQMASITNDKDSTTCPADELFFRGRLLPLHQKLLQTDPFEEDLEEETFCINFLITPTGSCNISPSQSCRVSLELNNDHLFKWASTELTTSSSTKNHNISPKKLWSKKLNLIKHSLISKKFKASWAFLKSLFRKSFCTNGDSCSSKDMKISKKTTPTNGTTSCATKNIESLSSRSFSAAEIKWHSPTKCLSSSSTNSTLTGGSFSSSNFSLNSNNGFNELNFLKRSSSFTSDIEGSIESAVAHCKKSQDLTIPTTPNIANEIENPFNFGIQ